VGLLASVMISGISTIVPLYVMFRELGLLNTYWPLLCIYVSQALPISIWLLKAYFDAIPREIDEAGLIDGCSQLRVLVQLILPVSRPALVAVSLYSFVVVWREFIIAATFAADIQIKTMPVGLYMFFTELGIEWGKLSAAAILVALPPMILIVAFQKVVQPWRRCWRDPVAGTARERHQPFARHERRRAPVNPVREPPKKIRLRRR
jgi:ABC-type glycerol-3-phosphate transport system permease component